MKMKTEIIVFLTVAIVGGFGAAAEATRSIGLKEQFSGAWKQVQGIDHKLLAGVSKVDPDFVEDAQGLKAARVEFIRNAEWASPKGPDGKPTVGKPGPAPTPIDATKPYIWISVSLWRQDMPSQPTVKTVGLNVDGIKFDLLVTVVASDAALATNVKANLNAAFDNWRERLQQ